MLGKLRIDLVKKPELWTMRAEMPSGAEGHITTVSPRFTDGPALLSHLSQLLQQYPS